MLAKGLLTDSKKETQNQASRDQTMFSADSVPIDFIIIGNTWTLQRIEGSTLVTSRGPLRPTGDVHVYLWPLHALECPFWGNKPLFHLASLFAFTRHSKKALVYLDHLVLSLPGKR